MLIKSLCEYARRSLRAQTLVKQTNNLMLKPTPRDRTIHLIHECFALNRFTAKTLEGLNSKLSEKRNTMEGSKRKSLVKFLDPNTDSEISQRLDVNTGLKQTELKHYSSHCYLKIF